MLQALPALIARSSDLLPRPVARWGRLGLLLVVTAHLALANLGVFAP